MMTKVRLRRSGLLALTAAAAFAVVTALYRTGAIREVDRQVTQQLRDVHAGWLDSLGQMVDVLFRPTPTFAAALVLAILLWRFGPRWSWLAPLAIAVAVLAEVIVKNGVSQVLHIRSFIDGFQVLLGGKYHAAGSFPSGHVVRAMFLATIALAYLPRFVSIPFALFALSTMVARIYTESHKLSDVLGGAFLGICVACVAVWAVATLVGIEGDLRKTWRTATARVSRRPS
jgi:membrane-associated phospholipid phosphatase